VEAARAWQAGSLATAAIAIGVGAALLGRPSIEPADPIELAVSTGAGRALVQAPVPAFDDPMTTPRIGDPPRPEIVLPQLRSGSTPVSPSEPAILSIASADDAAGGTADTGGTTGSGPTGAGTSSSGTTSSGTTSSGTTRAPAVDADSPESVDSASSADSDD
jgi:hypothetical protein